MTCLLRRFVAALALAFCANVAAGPTVYSFDDDSLFDGDVLTTQLFGLDFVNSVVLTTGISLNELEFPPRSDFNVIYDSGGAIEIRFSSPVTDVRAYLTYRQPVTLRVFDIDGVLRGSATTEFSSNLADAPGSSPNELLSLTSTIGISLAVFTGNTNGESFTLDDLTIEAVPNGVPEPSTLALALLGLVTLIPRRQRVCG